MVFVTFSAQEKSDMLQIYLLNNKSATIARREYIRRYPQRTAPSKQIFERLRKKITDTGSILDVKRTYRNCAVLNEDNKITILGFFEAHPNMSIWDAVTETGFSYGSIYRVLKEHRYKAYKYLNTQKLSERDCQRRLEFSLYLMERFNAENGVIRRILWTDESSFSTRRGSNRQTCRYWSTNNPRLIREIKTQGYQTVSVWCGVVDQYILGPIFLNEKLTGVQYLRLLQNEIADFIDNLPLNVSTQIIWQQDGAPPHNVRQVRDYLNAEYPEGWIGNGGTISWPPNSPDLTLMDYFFWGHIKNIVYKTPCDNIEQLKQRISDAIQQLRETPHILINARNHVVKILNKCIETNGSHVEQFL